MWLSLIRDARENCLSTTIVLCSVIDNCVACSTVSLHSLYTCTSTLCSVLRVDVEVKTEIRQNAVLFKLHISHIVDGIFVKDYIIASILCFAISADSLIGLFLHWLAALLFCSVGLSHVTL